MVFKKELSDSHRPTLKPTYVAPRTPLEQTVARIWADVLGRGQVGVHENLLALGGHSLQATRIVSRLRTILQVDIPVDSVLETATVASIAAHIETIQASSHGRQAARLLSPIATIRKRSVPLPLSFAQQRIWFLEQLKSERSSNIIATTLALHGSLHIEALEQSLNAMIRRHESLRTTFMMHDGQPVQIIAHELNIALHIIDLWHIPDSERDIEAQQIITAEIEQPFNLAHGPLLRATLLQTGDDRFILLLMLHQIIIDEWSFTVFLNELTTFYTLYTTDPESSTSAADLPELPIQYVDFAQWQRKWLRGAVLDAQIAYWKKQLAGIPELLPLPTDHLRPAVQTMRGATLRQALPDTLVTSLHLLGQREGSTFFMTTLAAFAALLTHVTQQVDIPIGAPTASRTQSEVEYLIGFFMNILVLRINLDGTRSFRELLAHVRTVALGAYAHQELPFDSLVEAMQPARTLSYHPLFQVMLAESDVTLEDVALSDMHMERMAVDRGTARFDLTLILEYQGPVVTCAWEYATDLFDTATIRRMMGQFERLLEHIVANPDAPLEMLARSVDPAGEQHHDPYSEPAHYPAPAPSVTPEPDHGHERRHGYVAPRSAIEEVIENIWSDVLGIEQAGVYDNFFALGGHSLLATRLVARLQATFQMSVPLRHLFEQPTIAGLAESLVRREKVSGQVEKMARLSQKIKGMSSEEIQAMLREKKQPQAPE